MRFILRIFLHFVKYFMYFYTKNSEITLFFEKTFILSFLKAEYLLLIQRSDEAESTEKDLSKWIDLFFLQFTCYCIQEFLDFRLVASSCHGHVWFTTTTSIDDWSQFFDQVSCMKVFCLASYKNVNLVTDSCN
ncbi:hypothetical protein UA00_00853 [Streptococcus gordonii]|nr:hypothetical protein UA00_00853 [Streptococcus gordonii]